MARNLTTEMAEQFAAGSIKPVFFFEGEFSSGTLRFWTGRGEITWNSLAWQGNGILHGFQLATETEDIEATGVEVQLAGVSQAVLQIILQTAQTGKPGKIWLGMLDENEAVIEDPYLFFDGKFDTAEILESVKNPEVALKYETRLVELERGRDFRFTPENQKIFYATDKGFDFVAGIQEWDGFWGTTAKPPPKKDAKKGQNKKNTRGRR